MNSTAKTICRDLASQLSARGVRFAILSPGSRNAPIAIAIGRCGAITTRVVIDERSAAFMALGYAAISSTPVALVCTSGTALLNYAPAVAEAFYRKIPLIVISADRPREWIDQDDSQTLRQYEALANIVKGSYDIPDIESGSNLWYANRCINDALTNALSGRKGPVHINIQLDEPLERETDSSRDTFRTISFLQPSRQLTTAEARKLGSSIASPVKVMVVAGMNAPSPQLNRALRRLAKTPNIAVMTETVSNLHGPEFISRIDTVLSAMTPQERQELAPDVVITLGGALISRMVKTWLREIKPSAHWHVGVSHTTVDCLRSLTLRIDMEPEIFFPQLASAMVPHTAECSYAHRWEILYNRAVSTHQAYVAHAPWSDLKAFSALMPILPRGINLQLSNGTSVRYAQLMGDCGFHRCDCNRGVSGIDGSTSTAVGAALAYPSAPTVLITGDMSAQYDLAGLTAKPMPPTFRMIVISNSGGGIFRFISSTRALPEKEKFFAARDTINLPLRQLAEAFNFSYYDATDETSLRAVISKFLNAGPSILEIKTDPEISAEVLTSYFTRSETYKNRNND